MPWGTDKHLYDGSSTWLPPCLLLQLMLCCPSCASMVILCGPRPLSTLGSCGLGTITCPLPGVPNQQLPSSGHLNPTDHMASRASSCVLLLAVLSCWSDFPLLALVPQTAPAGQGLTQTWPYNVMGHGRDRP